MPSISNFEGGEGHIFAKEQQPSAIYTSHFVISFSRKSCTCTSRLEAKKADLGKDLCFQFQLPHLTLVIPEQQKYCQILIQNMSIK